jgi:hypothetical protein
VSEFRCRDSRVAAFIAHLGIRHVRTEASGYSSFVFVFDDPGDCDKLSYDLFAGAGTSDALSLLDSYRGIKRDDQSRERTRRVDE